MSDPEETQRISTGIAGLDDILGGGLDAERLYLVEGEPGTGKTTLALQFLLEGTRRGEIGLRYVIRERARAATRGEAPRLGFGRHFYL